MDEATANWLVSPQAAPALVAAASVPDPESLSAASRMRKDWTPEQSAAALTQISLRRKARNKFGALADQLFFTFDGLQQATRAPVAKWRAEHFAKNVNKVWELGCGIGADSIAFAQAGLEVHAVDKDPISVIFTTANLNAAAPGSRFQVQCDDVTKFMIDDEAGIFIDPARRTSAGRSWRLTDLSPAWDFCLKALSGHFGCIKAGPGLARNLIPADLGAVWVSESGDLVELTLWSQNAEYLPQSRSALLSPSGDAANVLLRVQPENRERLTVAASGMRPKYLYEPDPAVIRAGGIAQLATLVEGWLLQPGIAYIASDRLQQSEFAEVFAVAQTLDFDERTLRAWVKANEIGILEIKVRGLAVDPAKLRRKLKPQGKRSAILILSPTAEGSKAYVVKRI